MATWFKQFAFSAKDTKVSIFLKKVIWWKAKVILKAHKLKQPTKGGSKGCKSQRRSTEKWSVFWSQFISSSEHLEQFFSIKKISFICPYVYTDNIQLYFYSPPKHRQLKLSVQMVHCFRIQRSYAL